MPCGCKKIRKIDAPAHIRALAVLYANNHKKNVAIVHCSDWDFCEMQNVGNRNIYEIITPDYEQI